MAWTDPPSYTNGQIITQTDLHVGLRDNMRELWHELAYVEFASNVATTSATPVDVVSSGALTYVANPIIVEFFSPYYINNGAGSIKLQDGATDLGNLVPTTIGIGAPVFLPRRLTPSAGSHTYKITVVSNGANTVTLHGGTGGAATTMPGYIRVWQRGG